MRVARYPVRITQTQARIERRRVQVARLYLDGMSLRQVARRLGVKLWTTWHDTRVIEAVWMEHRLAGIEHSVEEHQRRRLVVPLALWGHVALNGRLCKRLLKVLGRRRDVLDGTEMTLAEVRASLPSLARCRWLGQQLRGM